VFRPTHENVDTYAFRNSFQAQKVDFDKYICKMSSVSKPTKPDKPNKEFSQFKKIFMDYENFNLAYVEMKNLSMPYILED